MEEAKKVFMYEDNEDYDGHIITRVTYSCPNCHYNNLVEYEDRCPKCEQKLDWR